MSCNCQGDHTCNCKEKPSNTWEWTSVEEGLPYTPPFIGTNDWVQSKEVLVSTRDGYVTLAHLEKMRKNYVEESYFFVNEKDEQIDVTHWMPKPPPAM